MPGTIPSPLHTLCHIILTTTLWGKYYYHPHFMKLKNKVLAVTGPRSYSSWLAEVGKKPRLSNPRIYALTYNIILLLEAFQFKYLIHLCLFWFKEWRGASIFGPKYLANYSNTYWILHFYPTDLNAILIITKCSHLLESVPESFFLSHLTFHSCSRC